MSSQSTLNPYHNATMRNLAANATRHGSWVVSIGLILLVLATLTLVTPMVQGGGWYLPSALAATAALLVTQAARALTGRIWVTALAALLALAGCILALAMPASPLSAFDTVYARIVEFSDQIASDQPPLRESVAVTLVLGTVAVVVALLADIIAQSLRAPSVAPVAMLPLIIVPVTVGVEPAAWYFWALCLLALVLHFTLGHRWLQQGEDAARTSFGFTADGRGSGGIIGALTTGVAAIALAALIAVLLPPTSGVWWGALNGKAGLATNRVNPIIDLGDDLRRDKPIDIFRYATSQTSGELPHISLTTLSDFSSGQEWAPAPAVTEPVRNGEQPRNPDLLVGATSYDVNANIVLEAGVSAYLPRIGSPNTLTDLRGDYERDEHTGDMRQADAEALAQSYQLASTVATPPREQLLAAQPATPAELESYTALPDSPALNEIRAQLDTVVDGTLSPYAQALQLQEWFTGGAFDYSEQAPVEQNYDGTGLDVIVQFLQVRSGYCVHFASSMAVMGRMLDLPTRVQVGFTPGVKESMNAVGQAVYLVTTDDLHAWAEFWVPGYGWVPFETTPSDGINTTTLNPENPQQQAVPTDAPSAPTPTPTQAQPQPPAETQAPDNADNEQEQPPHEQRDTGGFDLKQLLAWGGVALAIVLPLLALTLLALLPRAVRRHRTNSRLRLLRRDQAPAPDASDAAWQEVLDTASDYGAPVRASATTGQQLERLQDALSGHPEARAAASRLALVRNAAHFADPAHPTAERPAEADVLAVRSAFDADADRVVRRRARWLPVSVLPGWLRRAELRRRARRRTRRKKRATS